MNITNRDIYLHVESLTRQFSGPGRRELRDYLMALWELVSQEYAQHATLAPQPRAGDVVRWLEKAFKHEVPASVPEPPAEYPAHEPFTSTSDEAEPPGSFAQWEYRILRQIHELELMRQSGQLADPMRYYGIQAPNGSYWYNFDPFTYLECGVRGTMGGYEEEDVIVLIEDPELERQDSPIFEVEEMTWGLFESILIDGASYE